MLSVAATAQTVETRQRQVVQNISPDSTAANLADDPVVLSIASPEDIRRATALNPAGAEPAKFQELMLAAIDQRLGARYSWGATGPSAFDCSGFVWSTFQSAGISFERGSARALWSRFAVATAGRRSEVWDPCVLQWLAPYRYRGRCKRVLPCVASSWRCLLPLQRLLAVSDRRLPPCPALNLNDRGLRSPLA